MYSTSALTSYGWCFVGCYFTDFKNFSGFRSTKPDHHVKVSDCGWVKMSNFRNKFYVPVVWKWHLQLCQLFSQY